MGNAASRLQGLISDPGEVWLYTRGIIFRYQKCLLIPFSLQENKRVIFEFVPFSFEEKSFSKKTLNERENQKDIIWLALHIGKSKGLILALCFILEREVHLKFILKIGRGKRKV